MAHALRFGVVRARTRDRLTSHDRSRPFAVNRLFQFRDAEAPGSNPGTRPLMKATRLVEASAGGYGVAIALAGRHTKSALVVRCAVTTTCIVPAHLSGAGPSGLPESPPTTEYEPGTSITEYEPSAPTDVVSPCEGPCGPRERFSPVWSACRTALRIGPGWSRDTSRRPTPVRLATETRHGNGRVCQRS